MALQKCDECGKQVSTKAANCPGCGAPVVVLEPAPEPPAPELHQRKGCASRGFVITLTGIFVFIATSLLISYLAEKREGARWASLTPEQQQQEIKDKKRDAKVASEKKKRDAKVASEKKKLDAIIKAENKRMAAAEKFNNRCDRDLHPALYVKQAIGGKIISPRSLDFSLSSANIEAFKKRDDLNCYWRVHGKFEAKNGFGVMLRQSYKAIVHFEYKRKGWTVQELEIDGVAVGGTKFY